MFAALQLALVLLGAATPARGETPLPCGAYQFARLAQVAQPQRPLESIRSLKIGTFNLRDFFSSDEVQRQIDNARRSGKSFTPTSHKKNSEITALANTIRDAGPDVLVVQEVGSIQSLERLAAETGGMYRAILVPGNDHRGMRNIGFLVKSDIPLDLRIQSHAKDERVIATGQRSKVFARDLPALFVRPAGSPLETKPLFIVLGTHGPSGAGGGSGAAGRAIEAQRAAEVIKQYRETYKDVPIIMAGDFNGAPGRASEFAPLRREGMSDAFDESRVRVPSQERDTHRMFKPGGETFGWQADAVMVDESLKGQVLETRVVPLRGADGEVLPIPLTEQERAKQPSDHRMVLMEFDFAALFQRWLQAPRMRVRSQ